jgi:hypothetical protein
MTVKTNNYQVGTNVTASKNIVLDTDVSTGDLIISKGVVDGAMTEIQRIRNDGSGMSYTPSGTGAVATTVQEKLRETVSVKDFGAVGDGVTDDTAAIQAAIDYQYGQGGGEVLLQPITYVVSATLDVPQRVTLRGQGGAFVNQYVSASAAPKGSVIFLKTGSNCDVVQFRCRLTNNGGVLEETTIGGRNSEARHFGGMSGITVWGNRSTNQSPTVIDLNSSGHGIVVQGSRYVSIDNTVSMYCAESGFVLESYDYGLGVLSSNNARVTKLVALSNAANGVTTAGGDSTFGDISSGYNGVNGVSHQCSGSWNGGIVWNNGKDGFVANGLGQTAQAVIAGVHSYDNDEVGFSVGAGQAPTLIGCVARGNGRDTGAASTVRCNFLVSSGAVGWGLPGCRSHARDMNDTLVTQYGFRILNTTYPGVVDGCSDEGSVTPWSISDGTKIIAHGGTTTVIDHPGMRLLGKLDVNGEAIDNPRKFAWERWTTVSTITANALPITTDSLIAISVAAPATVNDITYSGVGLVKIIIRNSGANSVTFTHNTAKIRNNSLGNIVLAQYQSVSYVLISANIWQQV